jgi:hypothetical protein
MLQMLVLVQLAQGASAKMCAACTAGMQQHNTYLNVFCEYAIQPPYTCLATDLRNSPTAAAAACMQHGITQKPPWQNEC